jgi:hypothetical protein
LKVYKFTYWLAQPALVPLHPHQLAIPPAPLDDLEQGTVARNLHLLLAQHVLTTSQNTSKFVSKISNNNDDSLLSVHAATVGGLSSRSEICTYTAHPDRVCFVPFFGMQKCLTTGIWRLCSLQDAWPRRYCTANTLLVAAVDDVHSDHSFTSSTLPPNVLSWQTRNFLAMLQSYASSNLSLTNVEERETDTGRIVKLVSCASRLGRILLHGTASAQAIAAKHVQTLLSTNKRDCPTKAADIAMKEESETELFLRDLRGMYVFEIVLCSPPDLTAPFPWSVVGWEPNANGNPGAKVADLTSFMDPLVLQQQAVDLNLRLMKWRLWPSLQLPAIRKARCLLLGAGTLGCAVARALLGWGVGAITLVDNGVVSYSNPSRQCLFDFEDARQKRHKAIAAADSLKRACPSMKAVGVVLSLPMPGHPYLDYDPSLPPATTDGSLASAVQDPTTVLSDLLEKHDIVFSLLDSREGRWLPTVMCAAYRKLMITAALGFESYVVMGGRHGGCRAANAAVDEGESLAGSITGPSVSSSVACYFCSDIVGARNSQINRSLDQQCTVTRPGLSFIAAGQAVELMVALIQEEQTPEGECKVEGAPGQIRGEVHTFTQMAPLTRPRPFKHCIACSDTVVQAYLRDKRDLVQTACNASGQFLEDLSGISSLTADVDLKGMEM